MKQIMTHLTICIIAKIKKRQHWFYLKRQISERYYTWKTFDNLKFLGFENINDVILLIYLGYNQWLNFK